MHMFLSSYNSIISRFLSVTVSSWALAESYMKQWNLTNHGNSGQKSEEVIRTGSGRCMC